MAMTSKIEKQLLELMNTMPFSIITVKNVYEIVGNVEETEEVLIMSMKYGYDAECLASAYKTFNVY